MVLLAAALLGCIALAVVGTACHSDRGGQFRAKHTRRLLANNDLVGSMGHSYGAGDNASMESLFSLLQRNVLNTRRWDTREELRLAMVTWIETKYNRRRRQRAFCKLTPIELRRSTPSQKRPDYCKPRVSTRPGADPSVVVR